MTKQDAKQDEDNAIKIQAMYTGPGPARYMLPTTIGRQDRDNTKRSSPAFSFGSRRWSMKSDSPGPAYAYEPGLGVRGKVGNPSFSFGIRPKTPGWKVKRDVSPGPGAYNTDMPPLTQRKCPAYSISPRTHQRPIDVTPGPNTYSLPSTLGDHVVGMESGPGVSMLPRNDYFHFAKDLAKSPGPARYEVKTPSLTKRNNPKFSITGRNRPPSPKNNVPGPGAYSPESVTTHIKSSPRYHIGVKHSDFMMPTFTLADVNN